MLSVISIVIVASLCFSVGEGLRLTPFPISVLTSPDAANVLLGTEISDQSSLHRYGPLDVPTQTQKRNKRQGVDFACPSTVGTHEIANHRTLSVVNAPLDIVSVRFVFRPAGRAPPFIS
jgi:hypothetical protein